MWIRRCARPAAPVASKADTGTLVRRHAPESTASSADPVPPIVRRVLGSPGQPLDAATRHFMEPRLGGDFSSVRLHTDPEAATSARALGARAYTFGRHVVVGSGNISVQTPEGRGLLAHELVHVLQQQPLAPAEAGEVGDPFDACEREAEAAVHAIETSRPGPDSPHPVVTASTRRTNPAIHRQVLEEFVAGFVGRVPLRLRSPAEMMTKRRALTPDEVAYAKRVFGDAVDYSQVSITRDSQLAVGAPRTIGNTIHLKSSSPWRHFKGETMELTQKGLNALVHEMAHVWQYQTSGLGYIPSSLWAQLEAWVKTGKREAAYDWRSAHAAKLPWEKWNAEQQAAALERYNVLLSRRESGAATAAELNELSVLEPYVARVRGGVPSPTR
jgi:Domain of unknown function (DUF4157)